MGKTVKYIASIPKKEYKEWLKELNAFASKSIIRIGYTYEAAHWFFVFVRDAAEAELKEYFHKYIAGLGKLKKWYELATRKAQIVYKEMKEPTIEVYRHYKDAIAVLVREQYKIISTKLISECNKIYEQIRTILSGLMEKLKEKIEHFKKEVIAKVEEAYGDFIARYGNMTWEEVISKVQDVSLRKYNEILKELRKIMVVFETEYKAISKKLIALKTEMKKIYNEFLEFYPFVKAKIVELKKYVVNKYNEIKPKVISLYNKYEKLLR